MHPEPTPAGTVGGFDHVALPMHDPVAMTRFYRSLGLQVTETAHLVQVYVGDQMINFHRPAVWQQEGFTLRASAAMPPCGDLCFVWDGSTRSLQAQLDQAGAEVIEGPVERQGGRQTAGTSLYLRDPDGNLLEFIVYSEAGGHGS
jgi:catechol 2,3-dioxygenase-like lactoylglutathione lyase family enzyme